MKEKGKSCVRTETYSVNPTQGLGITFALLLLLIMYLIIYIIWVIIK